MSLRHYQAEKPIATLQQNTKYVLSAADTLAAITSAVNPPAVNNPTSALSRPPM